MNHDETNGIMNDRSFDEIFRAFQKRVGEINAANGLRTSPPDGAAAWDEGYAAAQLEWRHLYDGHTVDPDVDDQMCTECGKGNPYA